jgi:hypothetical protein
LDGVVSKPIERNGSDMFKKMKASTIGLGSLSTMPSEVRNAGDSLPPIDMLVSGDVAISRIANTAEMIANCL